MTRVTRRTGLVLVQGGKAEVAAGAAGVVIPGPTVGAATGDARLLELERQHVEAEAAMLATEDAHEAAYQTLPVWACAGINRPGGTPRPWPEIDRRLALFAEAPTRICSRPRLEDVQQLNAACETVAATLARQHGDPEITEAERRRAAERLNYWHARQAEKEECERRAGLPEIQDRIGDCWDRLADIREVIVDTPARSPAGVAVKLRLSVRVAGHQGGLADFSRTIERRAVIAALEDLERAAAD